MCANVLTRLGAESRPAPSALETLCVRLTRESERVEDDAAYYDRRPACHTDFWYEYLHRRVKASIKWIDCWT